MKGDTWEGTFEIKHRTENAMLVVDPASGEELWLPHSQIEEIHGIKDSKFCRVVMSRWIAEKKGLL
jgi:hypothetical protein